MTTVAILAVTIPIRENRECEEGVDDVARADRALKSSARG